ncbi:S8 family serine peptidase [Conexibacter stalactiti]|uniref:S8 family serine peptidase n=1 Tax=Conexibacter stalactiti TaxID=1940611 RepID=A0ABU4HU99_9ACTN|nr:S8 family serine peptidase [Conexibacter stalactiti]MDW5596897.1 S8 family serine peptidase [Conexibacter stalactiti]MEC5037539.1 S8 family serine peptidase [Conexibacter stalactiti]
MAHWSGCRAAALTAATLAALAAASPVTAEAREQRVGGSAPPTPAAVFSLDRVIVQWAAGASAAERRAARADAGVDLVGDLGSRRFQLVETERGQTPRQAVRELEADPAVVVAERDGYDRPDALPNDPLLGRLWGLRNSGLGVGGFSGAVAGADIDASSAWDRVVGTPSTVVAVIDSGYRFEHPDLAGVAWTNPGETLDGADDDGNGIVDDVHGADFVGVDPGAPVTDGDPTDDDLLYGGHGVHTAGTIGARGNDGVGITGVAQDVSIMPLRVCSDDVCPHSAEVEAINYAGAAGARVANISLGGPVENAAIANAIAANPQTLFVISAGNDGRDNEAVPHYPCNVAPLAGGRSAVDNVICVAATDQADRLAGFSNWGTTSVDLGAPGTEILSTFPVRQLIDEDFEVDDFALEWSDSGADGGFARTDEPPLTSFGISDSPGAVPARGAIRASTSAPFTMPAGYGECALEQTRSLALGGGGFWYEVRLDGEPVLGTSGRSSGRFSLSLADALSGGGEVELYFRYTAGPAPGPGDGVWIDDVGLTCTAPVGEAAGYAFLDGTSMATPHVTGAAALLFSLRPTASVTDVRRGLLGSVDRLPTLAGRTTSGGRLDAAAAVDLFDAVPPPAPTLGVTSPPSPAANTAPRLIGSAQRGTSVDVYANATCAGAPVAGGTAAQLAGPGIAVTVGKGTVSQFSVRATDLVPRASDCSAPISYTESSEVAPPPPPPPPRGPDPLPPGGIVPPDPGPGPRPGPGPVATAPALSRLQQTNARWRTRAVRRRPRLPVGTTFRYRLDRAASVRLEFTQIVSGRRAGRGTLTVAGRAGANAYAFRGRLGRRTLAPGRYRLLVTALADGRRSASAAITFTIVR